MEFSYNLYKKHYEKYQEEKKKYKKYSGNNRDFYVKDDEPFEPTWRNVGISCALLGITVGAFWVVNAKWIIFHQLLFH